jgi:HSP20 family molecular chaperone IbpA
MSRDTAPDHEEDLYDITTAAAAAEAEILERNAGDAAEAKAEAGAGPETTALAGQSGSHKFYPPVDIFATPSNWTVQFTIPGAKKEDVSVRWDRGNSAVVVKGHVACPGEEEGLGKVVSRESTVGDFARAVRVPPAEGDGEKGEVDGEGIESRLEEGVLIVTVPRRKG